MTSLFRVPPTATIEALRGRPGDWSEPIDLQVDREALDRVANRLGLAPDLLAALLVERELALSDLVEAGFERTRAEAVLDEAAAAADAAPSVGPGNLLFGYLRDLRHGRVASGEPSINRWIMLPLRLHESLRRTVLAVDPEDAEHARRWEVAAASSGLQMREWALRAALLAG